MRTGPLRRRSLHAQAVQRLHEMIVTGELPPGARLGEVALSTILGISRTPLREALKSLAAEGLVALTPRRGARVAPLRPERAVALFRVLGSLEGLAAELAATRLEARDLARLERLHARMLAHHAAGDRRAYFRLNDRIHQLVLAFADNPVLGETHARLMVEARRGRYMAIISKERWDEAVGEHTALLAAFRAGDPDRAGRIWRRHLERTGEVVEATLRAAEDSPDLATQAAGSGAAAEITAVLSPPED
jgi:DNA-binding GntR family transcriptional regulator